MSNGKKTHKKNAKWTVIMGTKKRNLKKYAYKSEKKIRKFNWKKIQCILLSGYNAVMLSG